MKFQCNRKALSEAFQLVCSVVDEKTPKPVLKTVRVEAKQDTLKLSATDLAIGIVATLTQAVVEKPGVILVPATEVNSILHESQDETIQFSTEGTLCRIRGTDSDFKVPTENPEDFPHMPEFNGEAAVEIPSEDLDVMIRRTVFAVSLEQMRYALNGVLFVPSSGSLELVATDGRRLAHITRPAKCSIKSPKGYIVPIKGVQELQKMLGVEAEKVELFFEDSKKDKEQKETGTRRIFARVGSVSMFAQLVEGQFPNYREVIPTNNPIKVIFPSDDLAYHIRRAALVTSDESRGVQMHFEKDSVLFNARSAERGEAKIEMKLKYDREPFDIAFNPQYLLDMLSTVPGQEISIEMKDGDTPAVFRCGDDYLYVVMPINIGQE